MAFHIAEIERDGADWQRLLELAPVMEEPIQARLKMHLEWVLADHILASFDDASRTPMGVLRCVVQRIGEDEQRPLIGHGSDPLTEGKVIHFEVLRANRGEGIGRSLMERARDLAASEGCLQLRSRIWYTKAVANARLNLSMGAMNQPSLVDDSAYFIIPL